MWMTDVHLEKDDKQVSQMFTKGQLTCWGGFVEILVVSLSTQETLYLGVGLHPSHLFLFLLSYPLPAEFASVVWKCGAAACVCLHYIKQPLSGAMSPLFLLNGSEGCCLWSTVHPQKRKFSISKTRLQWTSIKVIVWRSSWCGGYLPPFNSNFPCGLITDWNWNAGIHLSVLICFHSD